MSIQDAVSQLGVLTKELAEADSIRSRVSISHAIFQSLEQIEKAVEKFVVDEIGSHNGTGSTSQAIPTAAASAVSAEPPKPALHRFSGSTLADAVRVLLTEDSQMHGSQIEKTVKAQGYISSADKFQVVLRNTLMRDGGFENIGGNVWRLRN
jgi:hypothetical protein